MKRTFLYLFIALTTVQTMNSSDIRTKFTTVPDVILAQKKPDKQFIVTLPTETPPKTEPDGKETFPLTIITKPEPDGSIILPYSIIVYDDQGSNWNIELVEVETKIDLPKGIYHAQIGYYFENNTVILFYSDIDLSKPTTIRQSSSDARVTMFPQFMLQNGSKAELPQHNAEGNITNRPNIEYLLAGYCIQFRGISKYILLFNGDYIQGNPDNPFRLSTNITGDEAEFVWLFEGFDGDNMYCTSIIGSPNKIKDGCINNNPSDYKKIEANFAKSLYEDENEMTKTELGIYSSDAVKKMELSVYTAPRDTWFCAGDSESSSYTLNRISKVIEDDGEPEDYFTLSTPRIGLEEGNLKYYDADMDLDYDITYTSGIDICQPINPYFSLNVDENPVFGSTCNYMKIGLFDASWAPSPFQCPWVGNMRGLYGDMWSGLQSHANFMIHENGKIVGEGPLSDYIPWNIVNAESYKNKSLTYTFSAGPLIKDGIKSTTTCEVYYDTSMDNPILPVLQHMTLRDNNGLVTNSFNKNTDGTISLAGGGFILHQGEIITNSGSRWYKEYTYSPADICVEYAPCGSEEFTMLEVNEIPEKFFMPGSGAYWEGSLSQITRPSHTGWYDLRITFTDKDGNYQRQTITSAFRITELAVIESITEGSDRNVKVTDIYNLQGIKIKDISVGSPVIERLSDGTVRKVIR